MTIPQWLEKARKMLRQKYFGAKTLDILTDGGRMEVEIEREDGNVAYAIEDLYGRNLSLRDSGRRDSLRRIISRTEAAKMLNTTPQALKVIFDIGDGPNCHSYFKDSSGRVYYYFESDIKGFAKSLEKFGASLPMGIGDVSRLLGISIYKVRLLCGRGELRGFLLDGLWHFRPENVKAYMERKKMASQPMKKATEPPKEEPAEAPEDVDALCAALEKHGMNPFIVRTDGGRNIPVCMAKEVYRAVAKPCQCRQGKLTE